MKTHQAFGIWGNKSLTFCLVLALAGCSSNAEPAQTPASSETQTGKSSEKIAADDEAIASMLRVKFGKAVRAVRVEAESEAGGARVKLRGEVPSEAVKEAVMNEVSSRVESLRVQDFKLDVSGIVPLIGIVEADIGDSGAWFSRDLRFAATFEREGDSYGSASIWDLWSRRRINRLSPVGHERTVYLLAFSPDGKTLATGHAHGQIVFWPMPQGRPQSIFLEARDVLSHNDVGAIAWSPDSKLLACVQSTPGEVWIWDVATRQGRLLGTHQPNLRYFLAFSPDGKTLASVSDREGIIILWDVDKRSKKGELGGVSMHVEAFGWSPDGKKIAIGRTVSEQGVAVWDVESRKHQVVAPDHPGLVKDVAFSPDGKLLVTRHDNVGVVFWDTSNWKEWTRLPLEKVGSGKGIGFTPDASVMALGCEGMEPWTLGPAGFQLWDLSNRPGGKKGIAEFPPEKFEPVVAHDDLLENWMLRRVVRDFGSIPNLELHVELRPDGSVRLFGKSSQAHVKETAQRAIEMEFPLETKAGKTPRKVINEIIIDDPDERFRKERP